jgi:hypothetical protein
VKNASPPKRAPEAKEISAIVEAMANADLTKYDAWNALDELSSQTTVEGINVDPAAIIVTGKRFIGLAAIYVALKYDADGDSDAILDTSDTFEGQFEGHFEKARPIIDKVTVDTTPFYE